MQDQDPPDHIYKPTYLDSDDEPKQHKHKYLKDIHQIGNIILTEFGNNHTIVWLYLFLGLTFPIWCLPSLLVIILCWPIILLLLLVFGIWTMYIESR